MKLVIGHFHNEFKSIVTYIISCVSLAAFKICVYWRIEGHAIDKKTANFNVLTKVSMTLIYMTNAWLIMDAAENKRKFM